MIGNVRMVGDQAMAEPISEPFVEVEPGADRTAAFRPPPSNTMSSYRYIHIPRIAWRRAKWGRLIRAWFYLNEWLGAWLGHRLIADHPSIADHLATRRSRRHVTMIPYGGVEVTSAPPAQIEEYGLRPGQYLIIIARIEPENSILPMVAAFSRRRRGVRLAALGNLDPGNAYHVAVKAAASQEVQFLGAIYGKEKVSALRFHARAYLHGHSVGGTNPSLVEALWSGNAVLAHRNVFNLWTAGSEQFFFSDENECDAQIGRLIADDIGVSHAKRRARQRAFEMFRWQDVLAAYERELGALGGYGAHGEAGRKAGPRSRWRGWPLKDTENVMAKMAFRESDPPPAPRHIGGDRIGSDGSGAPERQRAACQATAWDQSLAVVLADARAAGTEPRL